MTTDADCTRPFRSAGIARVEFTMSLWDRRVSMRRILSTLLILAGLLVAVGASAQGVYVNPYVRQDGSYVPGHYRSAPDSSRLDNWSSYGNVNPHTGEVGRTDPYRSYGSGGSSNGTTGDSLLAPRKRCPAFSLSC